MGRQRSRGGRMADTRLIGLWLPVVDAGIESTREQAPRVPLPAPNRLRIWWARCPPAPMRGPVLALPPLPGAANRYLSAVRSATGLRRARSTAVARRAAPASDSNPTMMWELPESRPDPCPRPSTGMKLSFRAPMALSFLPTVPRARGRAER